MATRVGGGRRRLRHVSGIENIYIVYDAVVIGIIYAEVNLIVEDTYRMDEHLVRAQVVAAGTVAAIVAHGLRQSHGAVYVELRCELTVRACLP